MANELTLSNLANDIYVAADVVGREQVGFIPSVTMNADHSRGGLNDSVKAAFTNVAAPVDISQLMTIPEGSTTSIASKSLSLSKSRSVQIPMEADAELQLRNGGQFDSVYGDLIAQAMRALTNEMEADLALAAKEGAGGASGAVGTSPFASNFGALATARSRLQEYGCPTTDLSVVLNGAQGASLRTLGQLTDANRAGSDAFGRQGVLLDLYGMSVRESGKLAAHTAGAATGLDIVGADAVGATEIALDGGDSGTILKGDVVKFANDPRKYVLAGDGAAAAGVTLNLNSGLLNATAVGEEMTIEAAHTPLSVFHRSALELAVRAPALPQVGDSADDSIVVQDPTSGLVFEVRIYKGYRKSMIEIGATWGVKAWKSDFIHTLVAPL